MKSRLELAEEEVAKIKREQECCKHEWEEVKYEPEQKEIFREVLVQKGVDSWYTTEGTGEYKTVDRWSRTCAKCGKKQYTYEQQEVAVKTVRKPRF